jgi:hypothetical protein
MHALRHERMSDSHVRLGKAKDNRPEIARGRIDREIRARESEFRTWS